MARLSPTVVVVLTLAGCGAPPPEPVEPTPGLRAFVGARAGLHKDVPDGGRVWGAPQMEERTWHRSILALGRLPDVLKRLRAVERQLGLRAKRGGEGDGER